VVVEVGGKGNEENTRRSEKVVEIRCLRHLMEDALN
jgi:hypothetical protein